MKVPFIETLHRTIRGGRMTKVNGKAASYAPHIATALVIAAPILLAPGSAQAFCQPSGTDQTCRGLLDLSGGTPWSFNIDDDNDMTVETILTTDNDGNEVTVDFRSDDTGIFEIISETGETGNFTFRDNLDSTKLAAGSDSAAIAGDIQGTGDVSITTAATITGGNAIDIDVGGGSADTDITIHTSGEITTTGGITDTIFFDLQSHDVPVGSINVSGAGIIGLIDIDTDGAIDATAGDGIRVYADNGADFDAVDILVNEKIDADIHGISVRGHTDSWHGGGEKGTPKSHIGGIKIDTTSSTVDAGSHGIYIFTENGTGTVDIDAGEITAGGTGINVKTGWTNYQNTTDAERTGVGFEEPVSVTASGNITAGGHGIFVEQNGGAAVDVTISEGATMTSGDRGIYIDAQQPARLGLDAPIKVTVDGEIYSETAGVAITNNSGIVDRDSDIVEENSSVIVDVSGTVDGDQVGVFARSDGTGHLTMDISGAVNVSSTEMRSNGYFQDDISGMINAAVHTGAEELWTGTNHATFDVDISGSLTALDDDGNAVDGAHALAVMNEVGASSGTIDIKSGATLMGGAGIEDASETASAGIFIYNYHGAGGTTDITIEDGATVSSAAGVAVTAKAGVENLENNGDLIGDVDLGDDNDRFGVDVSSTETISGTLTGNLDMGSGDDTVNLTGETITGDVHMGRGADVFTQSVGTVGGDLILDLGDEDGVNNLDNDEVNISGGEIFGTIISLQGDDTINVTDTGKFNAIDAAGGSIVTISSSNFTGAETVSAGSGQGGGITLEGVDATIGGGTLSADTVTISDQSTISSAIIVQDSDTLVLEGDSTALIHLASVSNVNQTGGSLTLSTDENGVDFMGSAEGETLTLTLGELSSADFAAGADTFYWNGGEITGEFDGGGADNTETDILSMYGLEQSVTGAYLKNWEQILVAGGSVVTVSDGNLAADLVSIESGSTLNWRNPSANTPGSIAGNLTNNGHFSMVDGSAGDQVIIDGDFLSNSPDSVITFELDNTTSDQIKATGNVTLGNEINLKFLDTAGLHGKTFALVAADSNEDGIGTLDEGNVTVSTSNGMIALSPSVSDDVYSVKITVNAGLVEGLNAAQSELGSSINPSDNASLINALAGLSTSSDTTDYQEAVDQLAPSAHGSSEAAVIKSSMDFANRLLSCRQKDGAYAAISEEQCVWVKPQYRRFDQDETATSAGFEEKATGISAGAQFAVSPNWFIGGGIGYESGDLTVSNASSSDFTQYQFGAVAKYVEGPLLFAVSVSAGKRTDDVEREFSFLSETGTAEADTNFVTAQLRAAYLQEFETFYMKPSIDVTWTSTDRDGVEYSGATVTQQVYGGNNSYVALSPAVEFGRDVTLTDGNLLRAYAKLGATYLTEDEVTVAAAFTNSRIFETSTEIDQFYGDVEIGAALFVGDNFNVSGSYKGRFSSDTSAGEVTLKAERLF